MADDKTLIDTALEAIGDLSTGFHRTDAFAVIADALHAFERLQAAFSARPVQRLRCLDRDGVMRCKLLEGHDGAHEMVDGPPEADRLAAAEARVAELEDERLTLYRASDFTPSLVARDKRIAELEGALREVLFSAAPHPTEHPAMTRAWAIGRAALSAPPDSGKADASNCPPGFVSDVVWQQQLAEIERLSGLLGLNRKPAEPAPSSYDLLLLSEREDLRAQLAAANAEIQRLETAVTKWSEREFNAQADRNAQYARAEKAERERDKANAEYARTANIAAGYRRERDALEQELTVLCDAVGFVNRPEGQGGYERASLTVLAQRYEEMERRVSAVEAERDALKADLAEAVGLVERYAYQDTQFGTVENDLHRSAIALLAPAKPEGTP